MHLQTFSCIISLKCLTESLNSQAFSRERCDNGHITNFFLQMIPNIVLAVNNRKLRTSLSDLFYLLNHSHISMPEYFM